MSKKSKLLAFSSILSLLANTHIAAVLRHAAEQIDHEFSVLQLRIRPGGERTAHASGESRDGAHSSARQCVDGSAHPGGRIRYLGRQAGLYPGKPSRADLEGKTRET